MNIRERLYEIPDLILKNRLILMTDEQIINDYGMRLFSFVDKFPTLEAALKNAVKERNIQAVIEKLADIRETLINIYADNLAKDCWIRSNKFEAARFDKVEAYVSFFLLTLTGLSIDIQLAFYTEQNDSSCVMTDRPEKETSDIKTILAVDDDPYCLDIFKAVLKDFPYKVIGTLSGLSALNILNRLNPDLLVLDIEMPEMNGIKLAKEIRASGNNAPIIFITGNAQKGIVLDCLQAGASDFIVKPINPKTVIARIQKIKTL